MDEVICSLCGQYEYGNIRKDREIVCHVCVQKLLGYYVVVREGEEYPFKLLRAFLRAKRDMDKGMGKGMALE